MFGVPGPCMGIPSDGTVMRDVKVHLVLWLPPRSSFAPGVTNGDARHMALVGAPGCVRAHTVTPGSIGARGTVEMRIRSAACNLTLACPADEAGVDHWDWGG